ncbi:Glycosyltransferase involved in cell wall bisynthesis [Nonlabens sp. Hel1_33_55]|uniref:glycosyltransferase family 4 protein n=1 Tax=Nonlabens sp. Hel1_33_55 TaxID=1336802 RepID=UPI000875B975|nr:glycosyltransferase family 4 protein [Nonlabens sp. Hel1_33_55]SCX94563.1 Glycosyltransferase involved in cell wall bisynthesis [Nonlabens sp. Hel1_33_55]
MKKLIRITTVPVSLEKLLEGQLEFMKSHFQVLAVSSDADHLKTWGDQHQIPTRSIPMTRKITLFADLKSLYLMYRLFLREKPQIVHTHTPKAGIVGMLAAYFARVPIRLHTVAGLPLLIETGVKRKILEIVEKLTFKCATMVYPNSLVIQEYLVNNQFLPAKKSMVIAQGSSNGIDTSYFDPQIHDDNFKRKFKAELGIPPDNLVFIFIGRLVSDKGINELIEAYKEIKKEHSGLNLLLVGPEEPDLDPLSSQTKNYITNDKSIITTGYQADIRPFLSVSNVLTFPSYREGFPNVVMQAGAMGLPAIVTNINGCNEIIKSNENGLIIPVKNALALQQSMSELLTNREKTKNLADNSRAAIVTRFERQQIWDALLIEYKRLQARL